MRVTVDVKLNWQEDEKALPTAAAQALNVRRADILGFSVQRRSIDARRGAVSVVYRLSVALKNGVRCSAPAAEEPVLPVPVIGTERLHHRPVVIGAGPCGLMAALALSEQGYAPLVLERGEDIQDRAVRIRDFFAGAPHDENSNVLFGDGGAGTFSDGKLTARTRNGFTALVINALIAHGAPAEICIDAKPHIGTDRLRHVIKAIKDTVIRRGGAWINGARVCDYKTENEALSAIVYEKDGQKTEVPCQCALLCTGHSARDIYALLQKKGLPMEGKGFAIGVRIEHPQAVIDRQQYGPAAEKLGAASYALTAQAEGRGVYSFCMCPGGTVIPSISEGGHLCVNGMSDHARDGANANAALVVQVHPADCWADPLAGLAFQRLWEKKAFEMAGDYTAPAQRWEDFAAHRPTARFGAVKPSYPRGVRGADLHDCLPAFVTDALESAMGQFDRRLRGYAMADAVLTGIETRTSAPVRILRTETGESSGLRGLYPSGEGAGYAGGIVSAGADGFRQAFTVMARFAPKGFDESI
ncbi:MAG: hypothetical protein IJP30_03470 [Clostridia bacterium]|nr:hypothetical protein [Clostridia bacterium]